MPFAVVTPHGVLDFPIKFNLSPQGYIRRRAGGDGKDVCEGNLDHQATANRTPGRTTAHQEDTQVREPGGLEKPRRMPAKQLTP